MFFFNYKSFLSGSNLRFFFSHYKRFSNWIAFKNNINLKPFFKLKKKKRKQFLLKLLNINKSSFLFTFRKPKLYVRLNKFKKFYIYKLNSFKIRRLGLQHNKVLNKRNLYLKRNFKGRFSTFKKRPFIKKKKRILPFKVLRLKNYIKRKYNKGFLFAKRSLKFKIRYNYRNIDKFKIQNNKSNYYYNNFISISNNKDIQKKLKKKKLYKQLFLRHYFDYKFSRFFFKSSSAFFYNSIDSRFIKKQKFNIDLTPFFFDWEFFSSFFDKINFIFLFGYLNLLHNLNYSKKLISLKFSIKNFNLLFLFKNFKSFYKKKLFNKFSFSKTSFFSNKFKKMFNYKLFNFMLMRIIYQFLNVKILFKSLIRLPLISKLNFFINNSIKNRKNLSFLNLSFLNKYKINRLSKKTSNLNFVFLFFKNYKYKSTKFNFLGKRNKVNKNNLKTKNLFFFNYNKSKKIDLLFNFISQLIFFNLNHSIFFKKNKKSLLTILINNLHAKKINFYDYFSFSKMLEERRLNQISPKKIIYFNNILLLKLNKLKKNFITFFFKKRQFFFNKYASSFNKDACLFFNYRYGRIFNFIYTKSKKINFFDFLYKFRSKSQRVLIGYDQFDKNVNFLNLFKFLKEQSTKSFLNMRYFTFITFLSHKFKILKHLNYIFIYSLKKYFSYLQFINKFKYNLMFSFFEIEEPSATFFANFILKKVQERLSLAQIITPIINHIFIPNPKYLGFKIKAIGRFKKDPRAKQLIFMGGVLNNEFSNDLITSNIYLDYASKTSIARFGTFGIKVWLNLKDEVSVIKVF